MNVMSERTLYIDAEKLIDDILTEPRHSDIHYSLQLMASRS